MKKNLFCKKILLISNMYPSKRFPHYGIFVKNTETILRDNGFQIDCVAIRKHTGIAGKLWAYLRFHAEVIFRVIFGKYDCVYAHYISHTALALLIIKKLFPHMELVVNVHGNDIVPEDEHDKKYLPLVRKVKGKVGYWLAPSGYFKDVLQDEYGVPAEKITIYPSGGVDCKKFIEMDKAYCRKRLNLPREGYVVGFVGRIEQNKGWDTLTEALVQLRQSVPDIKCLMVGSGDLDRELENLIRAKNLEDVIIRFPLVAQEKLVAMYNAMDVFCLPSYRKSESLALAGLEAMACGCIVIASDMAGPATYVSDGKNGYLFEPQNASQLAQEIGRVLNLKEEEKIRIKGNAKQTASQYDKEAVKETLLKVFREVGNE